MSIGSKFKDALGPPGLDPDLIMLRGLRHRLTTLLQNYERVYDDLSKIHIDVPLTTHNELIQEMHEIANVNRQLEAVTNRIRARIQPDDLLGVGLPE